MREIATAIETQVAQLTMRNWLGLSVSSVLSVVNPHYPG